MDICPISDVANWSVVFDAGKAAIERLGQQAAETMERVIFNAIIHHVSASGNYLLNYFKTSANVEEYYGMNSVISAGVMNVSATNVLAVSNIINAAWKLKSWGTKPYSGNDYIALMPSEVVADIANDSTFQAWHQYVEKGVDALYNGECGKVAGVRIIDCPFGPAKRGSNANTTASSIAYGTIIFGKGFYGVAEWMGGIETFMTTGASKADPLNQFATYGWKASMAAKVLNPSCGLVFWAGSRDTTAAYAESAGSGLRHEDPSSY